MPRGRAQTSRGHRQRCFRAVRSRAKITSARAQGPLLSVCSRAKEENKRHHNKGERAAGSGLTLTSIARRTRGGAPGGRRRAVKSPPNANLARATRGRARASLQSRRGDLSREHAPPASIFRALAPLNRLAARTGTQEPGAPTPGRYNRCPPLDHNTCSPAVSVDAWRPSVAPMIRMREPCRRRADYSSTWRRSAANELGPPDAPRWAVHAER